MRIVGAITHTNSKFITDRKDTGHPISILTWENEDKKFVKEALYRNNYLNNKDSLVAVNETITTLQGKEIVLRGFVYLSVFTRPVSYSGFASSETEWYARDLEDGELIAPEELFLQSFVEAGS